MRLSKHTQKSVSLDMHCLDIKEIHFFPCSENRELTLWICAFDMNMLCKKTNIFKYSSTWKSDPQMSREKQAKSCKHWFPSIVSQLRFISVIHLFNPRYPADTVVLFLLCMEWKNKSACGVWYFISVWYFSRVPWGCSSSQA